VQHTLHAPDDIIGLKIYTFIFITICIAMIRSDNLVECVMKHVGFNDLIISQNGNTNGRALSRA
jgi:hypothetical protein